MALKVVPIPAIGSVGGRPRKEALFDTDLWKGGVAQPTTVTVFSNFTSFAVTPANNSITKQFGRDTNLQGTSGLPAAHHHYWYGWRCKIRTYLQNLNTQANAVAFEEINRARETAYATFKFSTSELINCQLDELPSGTGPQFVATTMNASTVLSLPSGVPDRKNAKDVTVSGRPVEIQQLEAFRVITTTPQGFTPTLDYYLTHLLEGLLLRGVTG